MFFPQTNLLEIGARHERITEGKIKLNRIKNRR